MKGYFPGFSIFLMSEVSFEPVDDNEVDMPDIMFDSSLSDLFFTGIIPLTF